MKEKSLQVLLVEDNAGDARLLREMLREEKPDSFKLTHLFRMHEAEIQLAKGGVDIVLLDMGLPDTHGLDTVRRARTAAPDVPIIVLTGLDDEELAAEAMKEGAQDYLIKGQIENRALPRVLRYAIERHQMLAETDRIRSQQLLLKDEFLSHVSHELRSPLTSIYSFSTIISDGLAGETSPEQDEYLQIILRNVRQLQSMIEDLLEVTQAETGKLNIELQCVSVTEAITDALDTVRGAAASKNINFVFYPPTHLPLAHADPTRLRQILIILFDNAIKFTPIDGAVTVHLQVSEEDPNFLLTEVSDTGCGISPEASEHIFEHLYQVANFSQAGRKGLGLGLHIAKELVTRMDGRIWVSSEIKKGSHFFFTTPIFSLQSLIRPILMHEKKPGEAIAILVVEISSEEGLPTVPIEILSMARTLLQQCLRPDTDLLLPTLASTSEHKLFFVVAYTHEQGAKVIGSRILSQLQRHEQIQASGFTFSVSHSFLAQILREVGESTESFVEQVAAGLQARIKTICTQGASTRYERKNNFGR
jgi:signal transduction histidine kinase